MPNLFCPACKATYQDATLVYCLNDGTKLVALGNNSEETVQISHRTNPAHINLQNSEPTILANSTAAKAKNGKSSGLIIGVIVIGLLGILLVAGAIGAYFIFSDKNDIVAASPTPIVAPSPANTPNNANVFDKTDASTKELEEKINRLEKQLEAQKQANKTNSSDQSSNQSGYATAKVNSPNDGFLALRTAPSIQTGAQILKIPHGATVLLNNCEKTTVKVDGRIGRWCAVEYAGKDGWVFSAWLDY